jgi:hypothetical protein
MLSAGVLAVIYKAYDPTGWLRQPIWRFMDSVSLDRRGLGLEGNTIRADEDAALDR